MDIFTKQELVNELEDILKLVKKMPSDMHFHANVEFSGVDKKFMQLAQQWNIDKAMKRKKAMENIQKPKDNI